MLSINAIHFVTSATGSWLEKTKKKTFSGIQTPVFRISCQCFATWTNTFAIQLELDDEDRAGFNHSSYFAFKFFSGKQKNFFQKKKFFLPHRNKNKENWNFKNSSVFLQIFHFLSDDQLISFFKRIIVLAASWTSENGFGWTTFANSFGPWQCGLRNLQWLWNATPLT